MATELQTNLAKEIIKNTKRKKPLNKGKMLEIVGYKESVARAKPGEIIEQKGVKQALEDFGFSEENAKKVVAGIMLSDKAKDESRLKATDQVFKVHGSYKNGEGEGNTFNILNVFSGERAAKIAKRIIGRVSVDSQSVKK